MKILSVFAAVLIVTGCATMPHPADQSDTLFRARLGALTALQNWSFVGRVGISIANEGWQARLEWTQRGADYDIRIIAPLGQGAGRLQGGPAGVILTTPEHGEMRARDAESLLYTQFGWWVPIDGLRYWLRGMPDPAQPAVPTLSSTGRLTHLGQAGWDIAFTRYTELNGIAVPDRLTLENPRIKVKLVIEGWHW